MHSFEATIETLRSKGFKLTLQRLAVIRFMLGNKEHPSAKSIHRELKQKYSTLSFSTVYNTLNMLEKVGEIGSVHVFDDHLNYDPDTRPHQHLYCKKCRRLLDIFLEGNGIIGVPGGYVDGHLIDSCQVVFRGTCRDCLSIEQQ
jgi:Fur family peroxide stress response transcriptional regulator